MRLPKNSSVTRHVCHRDNTRAQKFRFNLEGKAFSQQFSKFYEARLRKTSPRLESSAKQKWGSDIPIRQVCHVVSGETCILIGTIFKEMKLQPSVLKELSDDLNLLPQPIRDNYTSEDDVLYLEDMLQRIVLVGDIVGDELVTGVNIAVKGVERGDNPGHFTVEDICFLNLSPCLPPSGTEESEVLLVCGLEFGGAKATQLSLQLLSDYVSGGLGETEDVSKVCRVIIVGDSVGKEVHDKDQHYKAKYLTKNIIAGSVDAVKQLNSYIENLTQHVPVTIMPGEYDPSNYTLPQQPLHPCMFTDSTGRLETAPNPYECEIEGTHILGHSGQPTNNIMKFSKLKSSSQVLRKCLEWGHIAPTAPDTLASYPYSEDDPFIIGSCPHLFFAGNQNSLEAEYFTQGDGRCLCLALPKFSETGICVKVNLKTLAWEPICFSVGPM